MADLTISVNIDATTTKKGADEAKREIKGIGDEAVKVGQKTRQSVAGIDFSGLKKQLAGASDAVRGMIGNVGGLGASLLGTMSVAGPAGLAIAAVGAAALVASKVVFDLAKAFAAYAVEVGNAHDETGLAVETLSALKFGVESTGGSFEGLVGGIKNYIKTIGDANNGSKEASAKLARLGIDAKTAAGDIDGTFKQVIAKIASLPEGVQRSSAAMDAFGESGTKLLPLIKQFNGDVDAMVKKAKELGVTLSGEDVRAAAEFEKALREIEAQVKLVSLAFGKELMPVVKEVLDNINAWLGENKGQVGGWAKSVANTITELKLDIEREVNDILALYDLLLGRSAQLRIKGNFAGMDNPDYEAEVAANEAAKQARLVNSVRIEIARRNIGRPNYQQQPSPYGPDDEYALFKAGKLATAATPYNVPGAGPGSRSGGAATKDIFKLSAQGKAIIEAANKLGISPLDLATIISYETKGTFSPSVRGGKGNNYQGLIQFGPEERKQFGVTGNQSFENQILTSVVNYFKVRFASVGRSTEGASILDLYKTVNGGNPNVSGNASDGTTIVNGKRVRNTITGHVSKMLGADRQNALKKFFGGDVANANIDQGLQSEAMKQAQELLELEARLQSLRANGVNDAQLAFEIKKTGFELEIKNLEEILKLQKELGDTAEITDPKDALARLQEWKKDKESVEAIIRDLDANAGRLGITAGIVPGAAATNAGNARSQAEQWKLVQQTLEGFASQTDETKFALESLKTATDENLTPLQQLDIQWKVLQESGRLTKEQIDLMTPAFQKLRGAVTELTEEQKKAAAVKAYKDLLADMDQQILELNHQLMSNTELTQLNRIEQLLLTDAYKNLSEEQRKTLLSRAGEIDSLRESLKAQEEARRAYEDFYGNIRDSLQVLSEQGFGAFFKNIYRKFKNFLLDMVAEWITSKFFKMFFQGGNQQQAQASGSGGGGIFGAIQNAIFGGGRTSGQGPGGTPYFNGNNFAGGGSGSASGNPIQRALANLNAAQISGPGGSNPGTIGGGSGGGGLFGKGGIFGEKGFGNNVGTYGAIGGVATLVGGAIGGQWGGAISLAGTGLAMGAQIGSMIMPGIGTAVGAAIGAVAGLIGGLLMGDPKKKRDKKENIPALNKGFTDALQQLRDLVADVRTLRVSPESAIAKAVELRAQIASGFGIKFESKKYQKVAQSSIAAKLIEADALIVELRRVAEISNAASERERRLIPEFASGVFANNAMVRQYAEFKRRNGMLMGQYTGMDTMPSMLAAGEMVLNPKQQQRVKQNAGLDPFRNAGIPGYAMGVAIGSQPSAVQQTPGGNEPVYISITPEITVDAEGMVRMQIKNASSVQKEIKIVVEDKFRNDELKLKRR